MSAIPAAIRSAIPLYGTAIRTPKDLNKSVLMRMLQRRTNTGGPMREMTVRECNQNFSQVIAAAERGETVIITKNGTPVAKIVPQPSDRANDPEWRSAFAALKASLRSKRATGFRVETINEDDKYGDDAA